MGTGRGPPHQNRWPGTDFRRIRFRNCEWDPGAGTNIGKQTSSGGCANGADPPFIILNKGPAGAPQRVTSASPLLIRILIRDGALTKTSVLPGRCRKSGRFRDGSGTVPIIKPEDPQRFRTVPKRFHAGSSRKTYGFATVPLKFLSQNLRIHKGSGGFRNGSTRVPHAKPMLHAGSSRNALTHGSAEDSCTEWTLETQIRSFPKRSIV